MNFRPCALLALLFSGSAIAKSAIQSTGLIFDYDAQTWNYSQIREIAPNAYAVFEHRKRPELRVFLGKAVQGIDEETKVDSLEKICEGQKNLFRANPKAKVSYQQASSGISKLPSCKIEEDHGSNRSELYLFFAQPKTERYRSKFFYLQKLTVVFPEKTIETEERASVDRLIQGLRTPK